MDNKRCRHCRIPLLLTHTKRTPKQLVKSYYYTAYYSCPRCKRMYLDDRFKMINENYDLFTGQHDVSGELAEVAIWTDGACIYNGQPNASAAWAFVSGDFEKAGRVAGKQTNNRAEAQAILEALTWAGEKGYRIIKIHADTQITLHGVKKDPRKVVANRDIFENIARVVADYKLSVQYEKVLAHSGIAENERVDALANTLATKHAAGSVIEEAGKREGL